MDIGLQVNSEKTKYTIHISPTECSKKSKYNNWKFILSKCVKVQISGNNSKKKIQKTIKRKLNVK